MDIEQFTIFELQQFRKKNVYISFYDKYFELGRNKYTYDTPIITNYKSREFVIDGKAFVSFNFEQMNYFLQLDRRILMKLEK